MEGRERSTAQASSSPRSRGRSRTCWRTAPPTGFLVEMFCSDADGDATTFMATTLPSIGKLYEADATGAMLGEVKRTMNTLSSKFLFYQPGGPGPVMPLVYDTFGYGCSDGKEISPEFGCGVNVQVDNTAPLALDQSVTVVEDVPKQITLTGSDAEGHVLTAEIVTPPAFGTLDSATKATIEADASGNLVVTYTPNLHYFGTDSFEFVMVDSFGVKSVKPGVVSITVTPDNDAPMVMFASNPQAQREFLSTLVISVADMPEIVPTIDRNGLGRVLHALGTATKAPSEISDKTQREASVFLSDSIDKVVAAQGYFDDSFDGGFTVLDNLVNAGLVSLAADGTEIGFIPIAKYDLIAPLIQKMFSSSLLDNEFIPGETGGMAGSYFSVYLAKTDDRLLASGESGESGVTLGNLAQLGAEYVVPTESPVSVVSSLDMYNGVQKMSLDLGPTDAKISLTASQAKPLSNADNIVTFKVWQGGMWAEPPTLVTDVAASTIVSSEPISGDALVAETPTTGEFAAFEAPPPSPPPVPPSLPPPSSRPPSSPPSPPPPPPPPSSPSEDDILPAITGGVVGGLLFVLLIGFLLYRRHEQRSQVLTMCGGEARSSGGGLLGDDDDAAGKSKVRNAATLEGGDD